MKPDPTISLAGAVDHWCDQFEQQWQAGQSPKIEDFLSRVEESARLRLFHELLALELELRRRKGETPQLDEYRQRFADYVETVEQVLDETISRSAADQPSETAEHRARVSDEAEAKRNPSSIGELVDAAQVAAFLTASGLLRADAVEDLLSRATDGHDPDDASRLLDALQDSGHLTGFQCDAIRRGRGAELILGNYVILDRLGRGGMGQVYRAWHRKMDRVVALKTLRPETMNSDSAVRRFHREVKAAARLTHPNIVTAYDADEAGGVHFLVMEYMAGKDLAALIREQGPASPGQTAAWVVQAARGLEHAHQQGIIHRDIKPGNLLLGADGTVKVLDMGLARLQERLAGENAPTEGLTRTGDVLGTLDYMAPEQILDTRHVGPPADIYSLGCTLHYLLVGKPPYEGRTVSEKLLGHRKKPIPSLRSERPEVPESLDRLFQRMVAKRPEDRPTGLGEVIAELDSFAASADTVPDSTQTYYGPSPLHKRSNVSAKTSCLSLAWSTVRRQCGPVVFVFVLLAAMVLFAVFTLFRTLPVPAGTLMVEVDHPGATVNVVDRAGLITVTETSGEESLVFEWEPGDWQVRVAKDGFASYSQDVRIEHLQVRELHVVLQVKEEPKVSARPESRGTPEYEQAVAAIQELGGTFLTSGYKASWSPDGSRIAFSQRDGVGIARGIGIIDLNTNEITTLVTPGQDPAWSPGAGKYLAYATKSNQGEQVWLVDSAGGEPIYLTEGGFPAWSPDGQTLYFACRTDWRLKSIRNVTQTPVVENEPVEFRSYYPALSSDARLVAFRTGPSLIVADRATGKHLMRHELPLNTGFLAGFSSENMTIGFGGWGAWDPLKFSIMDIETGTVRQVLPEAFTMPAWSPDGSKVAVDLRERQRWEIWLLDAAAFHPAKQTN
jgi:serine/threonine protein kinase